MKLYKLNNEMFQEPLKKGFDYENAVEILSPILEDGTIIKSHPLAEDLPKKADGSFYTKYNQDGTFNIDNEKALLISNNNSLISKHFGNILDDGFEFKDYWITCRRVDMVDLLAIREALSLFDIKEDNYNFYSYIGKVKSKEKIDVAFNKIDLEEIFKTGSLFIRYNLRMKTQALAKLKTLTLEELEDFSI